MLRFEIRKLAPFLLLLSFAPWARSQAAESNSQVPAAARKPCPSEMVRVEGFCIDRWEVSAIDRNTGERLSPFYPPLPKLLSMVRDFWLLERFRVGTQEARALPLPELSAWQRTHAFEPKAVSRARSVPQGYLSFYTAKKACENAGKRLCTHDEWLTACKGSAARRFPYGDAYRHGVCNVYRPIHPAFALHASASLGHLDPRLNLVVDGASGPLLRVTGEAAQCASVWGDDRIYDMVGNLDEWVDGEKPSFAGGFFSRSTTQGCEARVMSHGPTYFDYSTGTRCCLTSE